MPSELYFRRLGKIYETAIISQQQDTSGLDIQTFKSITGSRMIVWLNISELSAGTVQLDIENGVDIGATFENISSTSYSAPGVYTIILSDFHIYFNATITVTGGTASYTLAATLADNKADNISITGDVNVVVDGLDPTDPDTIVIVGTEDGEADGIKRIFVNNRRNQIVNAHDVDAAFVWADFGNTKERVLSITYTSPTFPAISVIRTFTYAVVGGKYRLDSDEWSVV